MGQMNGFSEASAVHFRVEDYKYQCQQGEESLYGHCCDCGHASPYTGDEGCSDDSLGQGEYGS